MNDARPCDRSETMRRVKSKNTKPELAFRHLLHRAGFRYRLHTKNLPGTPDIALAKYKVAAFVHGCFWHQHPGCARAKRPQAHQEYWDPKLNRNIARFDEVQAALKQMGWKVYVVWECELKQSESALNAFINFLRDESSYGGPQ